MHQSYRKALVLAGAFLNAFPLSLLSFFGNLLPYIDSYCYAYRDQIVINIDPLWTASVFLGSFILGMIFSTPAERCFGMHLSILLANIGAIFSVSSGYFAIKEPLALALAFGGLQGVFVGIVYAMLIKLLLNTMPDHGGTATGLMSAGPVLGALINVGVAYAVINPNNKKPDVEMNNKVFFSDKGLTDRVPYYFLVVGVMTATFTLIGISLIYIGSWKTRQNDDEETLTESVGIDSSKTVTASNKPETSSLIVSGARVYGNKDHQQVCKTKECDSVSSPANDGTVRENRKTYSLQSNGTKKINAVADKSPREIIKTARFWLIWLAYVSSNHTNYLHLNLYKRYGERVIQDDSLLVTCGIISNAGMVIVRPLVGVASDKIGIRGINVYLNAASCLFMSLMIIVLHTCPWIYLILVVVEYMGTSPHTMLFSLLTAYEFGQTNCGSNMGLIRSGNIALVLLEPFFVDFLIQTIGWDWLFLTGSLASAVATAAIMALDYFP
ncbi:major facilitator superfamily MFS-1 domain containing protein [Elysia marginata]|uniref:Major facilitator superfamily MFS-1 domain containing protein n=1 Tax=Elysia marginata TaxID=1093978 RepID=A0AAV4H2S0_9GAST|nr:major facilitator superfamily MFS-1 domain containing protein [Elysia marginata]